MVKTKLKDNTEEPVFVYFLLEHKSSIPIRPAFQLLRYMVKHIKGPALREKLFELVKLLHDFLDQDTAFEYVDIFFKYLANTDSNITKTDAVKAIETTFPGRGADMAKGWAQEYVEEGIEVGIKKGMLYDAREMLLEALDTKFPSKLPADVHARIQALSNRILLKKLLRSAIQSESINGFKEAIEELTKES